MMQCAANLQVSKEYQEQCSDLSPPGTWARAQAQSEAHYELIKKGCQPVYPARQRGERQIVMNFENAMHRAKASVSECGYEYPYVSPEVMSEVETLRDEWCTENWEFFQVPKP